MATGRRPGFWGHPFRAAGAITLVAAVSVWCNTDVRNPPRFDGAGYAVLAEALASGRGYREIEHPAAPRHAHFPPGYPAALAVLWRVTGRSSATAHGLSLVCTVAATLTAWRWFRTMYGPLTAGLLGLALAVNWTWGRVGGAIQSEPLFLLLEQLALLAAVRAGRRGGVGRGALLGGLLAACTLTRHVGVALAAAVSLDLLSRGRRSSVVSSLVVMVVLALPWVGWLATARVNTQASLLSGDGLTKRVTSQAVFYVQRARPGDRAGRRDRDGLPASGGGQDRGQRLGGARGRCAGRRMARALRSPRRRLAGLTALATLGLLLVWPFTEAGRFLIPLVPCLLVGAVEGLAALAARPVGDGRVWPRRRLCWGCRSLTPLTRSPPAGPKPSAAPTTTSTPPAPGSPGKGSRPAPS